MTSRRPSFNPSTLLFLIGAILALLSAPLSLLSHRSVGSSGSSGSIGSFRFVGVVGVAAQASSTASSSTSSSSTSTGSSSSTDRPRGVIELDAKNFDSSLRDGHIWLIEFYAPWCSHCTRFAPSYEGVARTLHTKFHPASPKKDTDRFVKVAKIDGAKERALSSRFGVKGFPTFFLVDGWTVREYDGSRSQESLIKFATTDYENVEPVPFLFGPFGPMGQLRALLMWCGTEVVGMYDHLTEQKKYKPIVAMSILCASGMGLGLVMIVVVGMLCLPKAKQD